MSAAARASGETSAGAPRSVCWAGAPVNAGKSPRCGCSAGNPGRAPPEPSPRPRQPHARPRRLKPPPVAAPLRSGQSRISPGSSRSLSRQPRAGPANPSARWSCGRKHKSRCPGTYFSRGHLTSNPLRSASAAPAGGAAPGGRRHLPGPDTCRAPSRRRLRLRERCPGLHPVRPQPGAGAEPRGRCVSRAGGASGAGLGRGVRESRPLGSSLPPLSAASPEGNLRSLRPLSAATPQNGACAIGDARPAPGTEPAPPDPRAALPAGRGAAPGAGSDGPANTEPFADCAGPPRLAEGKR